VGAHQTAEKLKLWRTMVQLGDFNNIRRSSEIVGNCHRGLDERSAKEFNEWITDIEVEDVPCVGRKFTWY